MQCIVKTLSCLLNSEFQLKLKCLTKMKLFTFSWLVSKMLLKGIDLNEFIIGILTDFERLTVMVKNPVK